ncbi:MAG: hypothetical protein ACUVQZ_01070 [Candidatus Caldatribacteriaceae bacterium]
MFKIIIWLGLIVVFLSGCAIYQEGNSYGKDTIIRGEILLPIPLFGYSYSLEGKKGEESPFPFAYMVARGENGEKREAFSDCQGRYEIGGFRSSCVILCAQREGIVIAGVVTNLVPGKVNQVEPINAYTTAQVAIFEAIKRLYPQSIYFRDIPYLIPPETFLELVQEVLKEGGNPLEDKEVQKEAHRLMDVWFGERS